MWGFRLQRLALAPALALALALALAPALALALLHAGTTRHSDPVKGPDGVVAEPCPGPASTSKRSLFV